MDNKKLDRISERVYNASFVLTAILILGATIGTASVRYLTGSEIELVPDNVFKFIKEVLWIFAAPHTVKLVGDKLPLVIEALIAIRGGSSNLNDRTFVSKENIPLQDVESGLGR